MRFTVVFVRFGMELMENDSLNALIRATESKEWGLRIVDNWGNPETLTKLWDRVTREEAAGGADAVCFLNSDCWVGQGWDKECIRAIELGAAIVGPHCNTGPQTAPSEIPVPLLDLQGWPDRTMVNASARRCRELWTGQFRESEVFGHCYFVTVGALRCVNFFKHEIDSDYSLYGSEQSLTRRIKAAGMKAGTAMGAYCYHVGEVSGKAAQAKGVLDLAAEREKGRRLYSGRP